MCSIQNEAKNNMTSKDKDGNILVNGEFKICNIPAKCSCNSCSELCTINLMIKRLYELEHQTTIKS